MTTPSGENQSRFTIFRTAQKHGRSERWLSEEMNAGRLRQGWGHPELALMRPDGQRVEKAQWESAHREQADWGNPSPRRFAILGRMLELERADIVVVPKMPEAHQFTIARVTDRYRFDTSSHRNDFGHIVPVDSDSIRTFDYRADDDAFLISALFARANHWPAVSFCSAPEQVAAALRLLGRRSVFAAKPLSDLLGGAVDEAFKRAAIALRDRVAKWNGPRFEKAVRQAFREQGYEVKDHPHYDGQGGDADIVVSPPARHGLFQPEEVAVQVKWKQGVDANDKEAVEQIVSWAKSQESNAQKYVISSSTRFTESAQKQAAEEHVVLIGGLQTMCFLLGVPERYRADWEGDG